MFARHYSRESAVSRAESPSNQEDGFHFSVGEMGEASIDREKPIGRLVRF
jgi:hypothetical protein